MPDIYVRYFDTDNPPAIKGTDHVGTFDSVFYRADVVVGVTYADDVYQHFCAQRYSFLEPGTTIADIIVTPNGVPFNAAAGTGPRKVILRTEYSPGIINDFTLTKVDELDLVTAPGLALVRLGSQVYARAMANVYYAISQPGP